MHNLATTEPDRAAELAAKWDAWATRANVKPYPAPNGARKANQKGKKRESPSGG